MSCWVVLIKTTNRRAKKRLALDFGNFECQNENFLIKKSAAAVIAGRYYPTAALTTIVEASAKAPIKV